MIAQSKPRRVKTPLSKIRDTLYPVQSEMPVPELVRSEPPEPVPAETKSKKSNLWISHVKSIAQKKGIKFRDALRDPETKATYKR